MWRLFDACRVRRVEVSLDGPISYYQIKRSFVQFGNKLNEFTELHERSECNSLNEFNLFPNCTKDRLI